MLSTDYTAVPPHDEDARPAGRPSLAPRVWAGALLLLAGLGLAVVGGCFLIGDLVIANPALFNPSPDPGTPRPVATWDGANVFLFTVLTILAVAFFVAAAVVFVVGFRGLCRILFGATPETP